MFSNNSLLQYLHYTLYVSMALSKVNMPEFSSTFSVLDVGFENGPRTFSLSPDHTSHGELKMTFFVSQVLNTFAIEIYII